MAYEMKLKETTRETKDGVTITRFSHVAVDKKTGKSYTTMPEAFKAQVGRDHILANRFSSTDGPGRGFTHDVTPADH